MGRRERQRRKSAEGKTVSAFTRMLVMVSSRARCGLNWYLAESGGQLAFVESCVGGVEEWSCVLFQIELIKHHITKPQRALQVIGNVVEFVHRVDRSTIRPKHLIMYSQFQQCQIRITVVRLIFALLCDVFLEYRRRFRVVSIEAVEDGVNVFGPFGREVERHAYHVLFKRSGAAAEEELGRVWSRES